ncbi:MAG TPA: hypothetical protein VF974_07740 [Patescibacteria group bacterium]
MRESGDSLLGNLKGLAWSAIIGVASFQLLAPQIWGYIHDSLDIRYGRAYWIFTVVYFLIIPVCLLMWLYFNWKILIKYLYPFNEPGQVDRINYGFLVALSSFISFQLIMTLLTFRLSVPYWLCIVLLCSYCLSCGAFLWFYMFATYQRIRFQYPNPTDESRKITKHYQQMSLVTVVFFVVLFLLGFLYVCHWHHDKEKSAYAGNEKSAFDAGKRGFALLDLRDTLIDRYDSLADFLDSAHFRHLCDTLVAVDSGGYYLATQTTHDTVRVVPDDRLKQYAETLCTIHSGMDLLDKKLKDRRNEVVDDSIKLLASQVPTFRDVSAPADTSKNPLNYGKLLGNLLNGLAREADKQSRIQLGLQLRSVQAKGLILLISLLFIVASLYIFLNICQRLQNEKVKEFKDKTTVGDPFVKEFLVAAEDSKKEISDLSGGLWLYLSIIVWLLVPLFKPVKDADINTKQVFYNNTLADNSVMNDRGGGSGGGDNHGHGNDTSTNITRTIRIDSIYIQNDSLKYHRLMDSLDSIGKKVSRIHQRVFGK